MKAIKFKEANTTFAKDQAPYKQLPAFADTNSNERIVVTCYKMSLIERIIALFTGRVWLSVMTFGESLHPQKMEVRKSEVFVKTN